jgi:uncharacterized membrane protein
MSRLRPVETITVSIERPPQDVYEYVANPANLPRWASGLAGGIESVKGEWIAVSPVGRVKVRFLFRRPEMTDEKFREDAQWVRRDLARLETILEGGN